MSFSITIARFGLCSALQLLLKRTSIGFCDIILLQRLQQFHFIQSTQTICNMKSNNFEFIVYRSFLATLTVTVWWSISSQHQFMQDTSDWSWCRGNLCQSSDSNFLVADYVDDNSKLDFFYTFKFFYKQCMNNRYSNCLIKSSQQSFFLI